MLQIIIPSVETFNEETSMVGKTKETVLQLEHSLISLSRWESKWKVPFLSKEKKTDEQIIDYIRCMTVSTNVDPNVYFCLTPDNIRVINNYIEDDMTATTFVKSDQDKTNREIFTAEIIYYWMISYNIPFETQKWHLNRLLTLINVCNLKNQPAKKMSRREILSGNRALNARRRAMMNSQG